MNIFLIVKCGFTDSYNFISQLTDNPDINKLFVFRDSVSLNNSKIEYVLPKFNRNAFLKTIARFVQIIVRWKANPKIIIGIYEIPHGLLAMLTGKILNVSSVVSVIGNPAYSKLRKGFRLKLTMWILKNCDFVTVTGTNSKRFLSMKGIDNKKILVLPNTLDFFPFTAVGVEKKYAIVSLGRISEEKHVEVIVKIVYELKHKIPDIKAAIGGEGPALKTIIELIKQLGLESNVDLYGFIPDENLNEFYNNGKVFILTSETEGFPRTIIQAAACGIPVIASNVGDISDVIDHNINGYLVNDYDNVKEYSMRVLQLLNDSNLYTMFSENLNLKVRKEFVTEKAIKVWKEVLQISLEKKLN